MRNKMTISEKKEALQNGLNSCGLKYSVQVADARLGQRFAIAEIREYGTINIKGQFMTYDEFNCFIRGYITAKSNKL